MSMNIAHDFINAIRSAGITPPESVEADGKLHRFPTNGHKDDDSGYYVVHTDGVPAGAFGCWRNGLRQTWRADLGRNLTPAEMTAHRERVEAMRRAREAEEARRHAEARERAAAILEEAEPATDHPYLQSKGIKPHGVRIHQKRLAIPLRDHAGVVHSVQFIAADGEKKYLPGGRVKGCYFSIGTPDGVVCIVEGFATGASIHEATGYAVAVAFTAGNLKDVAIALRKKYPDIRLILCADDDVSTSGNPGRTKASEAAQAVGGQVVVPEFGADRPEGATDFNDLAAFRGPAEVKRQIAAAPISTISAISSGEVLSEHKPRPLQRQLAEPTEFPVNALGSILGNAAIKMAEVIQAPIAMCGNSVMAATCLAAQAYADVVIDGRTSPLSEFFVTIGESGERKSAVDHVAQWPIRKHESKLIEFYELSHADYRRAADAYNKAKDEALSSKAKGYDEKKKALDALADREPTEPLAPMMLCEEPTYEGVVKMLQAGQPSIGLCSDEGGRFIGGHGMNSDNLLKTAAGMSGLWDGKPISRVRAGDGAALIFGKRLSVHLMVQPDISRLMLSNRMLLEQGLLSRCLVTWPKSTAGTRAYKEIDLSASVELRTYGARLLAMLETPMPIREGTRNELNPRHIPLAPDAKRLWIAFHDAIEGKLMDGGELAPIRGLANKAPEHAARLAGALALVDDINAAEINLRWMKAGIELTTHYINEGLRLFDAGTSDPQLVDAEKLLRWLQPKAGRPVSLVEIYQQGPSRVRTAKVARDLMHVLEDHGYVVQDPNGTNYEGAIRREAWRVVG